MKDAWPVQAQGLGARGHRGEAMDQNLDVYSVEYTFGDGTKLFLNSRYATGCHEEFASYAHGTRGAAVISSFMHTPAKCRTFKGHNLTRADQTWAFPQPEPNPYQLEWDNLVGAIRQDKAFNEVKRGASPPCQKKNARTHVRGYAPVDGSRSAHGDKGDALALVVAGDALRPRVERQNTIDHEGVTVVAVAELDGQKPRPIRHLLHRMRGGVPPVEVTHETDGSRLRRVADKVHRPQRGLIDRASQRTQGTGMRRRHGIRSPPSFMK
jgi:hypothetical protein